MEVAAPPRRRCPRCQAWLSRSAFPEEVHCDPCQRALGVNERLYQPDRSDTSDAMRKRRERNRIASRQYRARRSDKEGER